MTTREYLHTSNIEPMQLAELLGYKSTQMITKRMDEEMPERWVRKLEELSDLGVVPENADSDANKDNDSEREPKISDDDLHDWINPDGRDNDKPPNVNATLTGNEVIGPQQIKLSTIKGYIEMVYGGAEALAQSRGDLIAAETINKYKPEYVEAWMDYIKFDPRIMKYLEQLQIGTPLGNLIGIHAISIGAYVLARVTAKEIANLAAQEHNPETEL